LLLGVHRQDEDRQIGLVRTDLPQQVDARAVRQRDVEQQDVEVLVPDSLQRLLRRAGLAGDDEVRFFGEQSLHALAKESVIVRDEYAMRRANHRTTTELLERT
jgi:hypothetical protein